MLLHGQKPSAKVRMVFFLTSLAYTQVFVEKRFRLMLLRRRSINRLIPVADMYLGTCENCSLTKCRLLIENHIYLLHLRRNKAHCNTSGQPVPKFSEHLFW